MKTDRAFHLKLYEQLVLIREFEERVKFLFLEGTMPGTIHQCQGQEATAVGVCAALRPDDFITSTFRGHGHALAKGLSVQEMLDELFGATTGCCKGEHAAAPAAPAAPAATSATSGSAARKPPEKSPESAAGRSSAARTAESRCYSGNRSSAATATHSCGDERDDRSSKILESSASLESRGNSPAGKAAQYGSSASQRSVLLHRSAYPGNVIIKNVIDVTQVPSQSGVAAAKTVHSLSSRVNKDSRFRLLGSESLSSPDGFLLDITKALDSQPLGCRCIRHQPELLRDCADGFLDVLEAASYFFH